MIKMDRDQIFYLVLLAGAGVLVYLYMYNGKFTASAGADLQVGAQREGFESSLDQAAALAGGADGYLSNSDPAPTNQVTDAQVQQVEGMESGNSTCFPKDQLTPQELLPQDYSSTWAKCNPTGVGSLDGKNFLDAGHHIGINTVGQTLRNANLQLRSEPPNPQVVVSPWSQSSVEPDTNRRYLEIGNC